MIVWIDRDTCDSNLSACLSCFGELMVRGKTDRGCILDTEDDGSEDVTVYMRSGGEDHGPPGGDGRGRPWGTGQVQGGADEGRYYGGG